MRRFLPFFLVLALLVGGLYLAFSYYVSREYARGIAQAQREKVQHDQDALADLRENHIDRFKADLKKAGQDYKAYTAALQDFAGPESFSSPEYAEENYNLFMNDIAPSFRQKAEAVLNVFSSYSQALDKDARGDHSDTGRLFLEQWQKVHDANLARSVALLSVDEQLLQAYESLITFYYSRSKLYRVDMEAEEFVFKRAEDETEHEALLDAIADIRREKLTMRRR